MDHLELVPKPPRETINVGPRAASADELIDLLGNPRDSYTGKCQPITNAALKAKIKTESVGPFRATGHVTALESLRAIFSALKSEVPDLHAMLGSAGMECARLVKLPGGVLGKSPSNHSWGLAIDIKLNGELDEQGDDKVQRGLLILARYFTDAAIRLVSAQSITQRGLRCGVFPSSMFSATLK